MTRPRLRRPKSSRASWGEASIYNWEKHSKVIEHCFINMNEAKQSQAARCGRTELSFLSQRKHSFKNGSGKGHDLKLPSSIRWWEASLTFWVWASCENTAGILCIFIYIKYNLCVTFRISWSIFGLCVFVSLICCTKNKMVTAERLNPTLHLSYISATTATSKEILLFRIIVPQV